MTRPAQNHPREGQEPSSENWHAREGRDVLGEIGSGEDGLAGREASQRLARHGANTIPVARPDGPLKIFVRQFNSPLLFVLLGSGGLALALGKVTDGAVVLGVVLVNAIIGFIQEFRAQKAITALGQMVPEGAAVRRDGRVERVPAAQVVPGDVVLLQSGDRVPADLRLLSVKSLQVDESALTGEAVPVAKQAEPVEPEAGIGDRSCMAYGGTMVTYGTGVGAVVATGGRTELGKISALLHQTEVLATPLTKSMARVSLWLTFVILGVTGALFGVGLLRGYAVADATVAAISLAVAAIPEGLPAIITIALAIGVSRMARRRVVIRSLPAVETLGSTTVICSDKTGTLTRNEMTVQSLWTPTGAYELGGVGYAPQGELSQAGGRVEQPPADLTDLLRAGALCNDSALRYSDDGRWAAEGDPTEVALIVAARKVGLQEDDLTEQWPRLDAVPFESERQIMGTLHLSPDGRRQIIIKGAPEVVFKRCTPTGDRDLPDTPDVHAIATELAGRGLRVLAMAAKTADESAQQLEEQDLSDGFHLLGLQAMSDPPRQEAIESVQRCKQAGIRVKMITGDHAATARAIGDRLGLGAECGDACSAVTGAELNKLSPDAFSATARSADVFARVAPEHKLRLVSTLQDSGEVVAMTGDGVNDAPALKRADIGVAMGITGTAVSRQAADMVLTDDNFASIVSAVEEGRRVFDNLVKSLVFVLPTNIGEALVIMAAVLFFPVVGDQPMMPILPVQILWVNLVATVALALPLAFEALEPNVMDRPPRPPKAPILDAFVLTRTAYVAVLMTGAAIGLFFWELNCGLGKGLDQASAMGEAQTAAVTAIVAFQIFYLFTCRSLMRTTVSIGVFSNPAIFLGVGTIILLQVGFVYLPFMNALFGSAPMDPGGWLRAVLVGSAVWPVVAIEKLLRRKREHLQGAR